MRKNLIILAVVTVALALTGCTFPLFVGTAIPPADVTASQAGVNAAASVASSLLRTGNTAALNPATLQKLTISFSRVVDAASLTAIKIYTLKGTAAADGARDRNADIAGTPVVTATGTGCDVLYTLDLSGTTVSTLLEIAIAGDGLTAAGGTLKLNTDLDAVPGEALEDDIIRYVTVAGAPVTAAGAARNPQGTVTITPVTVLGVGTGSFVLQLPHGDFTEPAITALFGLQKFNPGTKAWDDVAISGPTFNSVTFQWTGTFAATVDGQIYRTVARSPHSLQETVSHNGYQHRASNDQDVTFEVTSGPTPIGALATQTAATVLSATATFDGTDHNGYVTVVFNGLAAGGITATSVTAAGIQIFDTTAGKYVPWATASVSTTTTTNDTVRLNLDPAYTQQGDNFRVYTFPELLDGTLTFGDWTKTTYPYFSRNMGLFFGI